VVDDGLVFVELLWRETTTLTILRYAEVLDVGGFITLLDSEVGSVWFVGI
jgi:hypothetical protein